MNGVREWELVAEEKTIEVAPGVKYDAWAYNGRVPGPTLRAREGERLRVRFVNGAQHPHTIHFHGIHTSRMDGIPGIGAGNIAPGESTTYEFHATPFGLHLYHCHSMPLAEHIAKGLYGAFIIDPKQGRPEADELVMVMNGFDTNFDRANEVYAVNTVAFEYLHRPVVVKRDQLVRIYLVNTLEFDLLNSFHIHANFFDYYPTGTRLEPRDFTDTVIQGQGERGILELRFPYPGKYMFHAHVSRVRGARLDGLLRGDRLMEAATARGARRPPWLAGVAPLAVLAVAIGLFVALDAPGLNRIGVPQEKPDRRADRAEARRDPAARAQRRPRSRCACGR